jgi:microsomal dipeptidase-like Zn-dependent dipeptidase
MIADMHAHYPMRVVEGVEPGSARETMRKVLAQPTFGDKFRAFILRIASTVASNRNWWSGYRITPESLRKGNVGLAMSVLYRPFEEMDLEKQYADPPDSRYFGRLMGDLEMVERKAAVEPGVRVVRNLTELEDAFRDNETALVHCVEGGFHLGADADEVKRNVATLATKGVAYITLAHLFFRQVATNAPALPFLKTDAAYRELFPQPKGEGLTPLGEAAIEAMVDHRVMVDISHMSTASIRDTVRKLDELDPDCELPLIATHGGYRFGNQEYMPDEYALLEIKRRKGVVGLIMAQYQLIDGVRCFHTRSFKSSYKVIRRHIDKIAAVTGSRKHIALGTDFDGFIKPTMGGLEDMGDLAELEQALIGDYGEDAAGIASQNAIDVLRRLWSG